MNTVASIVLGIVCGCASVLTTVGNGLVIFVIWWTPALQTPSNLFIVSLAVADFIIGVLVMPFASVFAIAGFWPLPQWLCTTWISFDYVASSSSILNLMTMAIDRYFSIVSPITYRNKRTHNKLFMVIVIVWCCSVVYMLPILCWDLWFPKSRYADSTSYNHNSLPDNGNPPGSEFSEISSEASVSPPTSSTSLSSCSPGFHDSFHFKIISLIYSFIIPFITMCLVYVRIFVEIHRRTKRDIDRKNKFMSQAPAVNNNNNNNNNNHELANDSKPDTPAFPHIPLVVEPSPNLSESHFAEHKNEHTSNNYSGKVVEHYEVPNCPLESSRQLLPATGDSSGTATGVARDLIPNSPSENMLSAPKSPLSRRLSWRVNRDAAKRHHQKSLERQREIRAAKKLAGIVLAFCVCWLPYMVMYVLVAMKPVEFSVGWRNNMFTAAIWLGYFNSTLNPMLYPFCIEDFKKALKPIVGSRLAQFL